MIALYIMGAGLLLMIAIVWLSYRRGEQDIKTSSLKEDLDHAKEAKDVRSGKSLGDEWMHYRD